VLGFIVLLPGIWALLLRCHATVIGHPPRHVHETHLAPAVTVRHHPARPATHHCLSGASWISPAAVSGRGLATDSTRHDRLPA
jgi:hypothetical protein